MGLIQGSLVRFTARFWSGTRPYTPKAVAVTIEWVDKTEQKVARNTEPGVFVIEMILDGVGPVAITFKANTGEFSLTTYEVARARSTQGVLDSIEEPTLAANEPVIEEEKAPEPPKATFDRAASRSRLMAAGIPVDDAWSDAKVKGAVSALDDVERQRRAWGS